MQKRDFYRLTRVAGMLFFVPMILAVGPISGYFCGDFLEKRLGWPSYTIFITIGLGLMAGIYESVRIIKLVLKIERKP